MLFPAEPRPHGLLRSGGGFTSPLPGKAVPAGPGCLHSRHGRSAGLSVTLSPACSSSSQDSELPPAPAAGSGPGALHGPWAPRTLLGGRDVSVPCRARLLVFSRCCLLQWVALFTHLGLWKQRPGGHPLSRNPLGSGVDRASWFSRLAICASKAPNLGLQRGTKSSSWWTSRTSRRWVHTRPAAFLSSPFSFRDKNNLEGHKAGGFYWAR